MARLPHSLLMFPYNISKASLKCPSLFQLLCGWPTMYNTKLFEQQSRCFLFLKNNIGFGIAGYKNLFFEMSIYLLSLSLFLNPGISKILTLSPFIKNVCILYYVTTTYLSRNLSRYVLPTCIHSSLHFRSAAPCMYSLNDVKYESKYHYENRSVQGRHTVLEIFSKGAIPKGSEVCRKYFNILW